MHMLMPTATTKNVIQKDTLIQSIIKIKLLKNLTQTKFKKERDEI